MFSFWLSKNISCDDEIKLIIFSSRSLSMEISPFFPLLVQYCCSTTNLSASVLFSRLSVTRLTEKYAVVVVVFTPLLNYD